MSVLIQNTLINAKMSLPVMAAETADDFIFGLDIQFVFDAVIAAIAMFVLFMFLSYVLFNPARDLMKKRQEMIDSNINKAKSDMEEAESLKVEYTGKLANAEKEAQDILSNSRKKALKRENEIVDEAKLEARRIIDRADKEALLEKNKMKDEVKKEIISVASVMAGKFVAESISEEKQIQLVNDTLKEMGDETWQN